MDDYYRPETRPGIEGKEWDFQFPHQSQAPKVPRNKQLKNAVFFTLLNLMLLLCLFMVFTTLTSSFDRLPRPSGISDCGESVADARRKNCRFDVMSFSWLPLKCHDGALSARFLRDQRSSWTWWLDEEGQTALSEEDVSQGDRDGVLVSWQYHLSHCLFMWAKLHRAVMSATDSHTASITGGSIYVDDYVMDSNRTQRCQKLLSDRDATVEGETTNTRLKLRFARCGRADAIAKLMRRYGNGEVQSGTDMTV